jgi:hypothetical protein
MKGGSIGYWQVSEHRCAWQAAQPPSSGQRQALSPQHCWQYC